MESSDFKKTTVESKSKRAQIPLPPRQRPIKAILRWNIDHPGITPENPIISHDQ